MREKNGQAYELLVFQVRHNMQIYSAIRNESYTI